MLAAAILVAGSTALIGSPAQAATVHAHCEAGLAIETWILDARAHYTAVGANNYWDGVQYKIWGGLSGDDSNVNIRLRTGSYSDDDPTHWSYNSPDNVKKDIWYSVSINKSVPETNQTYLKFHAIFDIPWYPDRGCVDYTDQV
jgi:hypothetical protein